MNSNDLAHHLLSKREEDFEHAPVDRENAFYEAVCSGNMELVRVFAKPLFCEGCGILSENKLQNLRYHVVVLAAVIARYCIRSGMTPEESYSLSDYYIMKVDKSMTEEAIRTVHAEMIEDYTNKMRVIRLKGVYSRRIVHAIDYIICRLHKKVYLDEAAGALKISPAYLSRLFREETGMTFSEYVNKLKIEEAAALLLYTEYTDTEISSLLCFSSQSYFIKIFRRFTGTTPKKYKKQFSANYFDTPAESK